MRQIKFRGVGETSKEWVEGDLIHGVGPKSGKVYILPSRINLSYVKNCDPLDGVCVIPESVGQFTGLKDKNGKEIYEGDILSTSSRDIALSVFFGENTFDSSLAGFCLKSNETGKSYPIDKGVKTMEVVGNIYDNPELLQ